MSAPKRNAAHVAKDLGQILRQRGIEYALGGAIALGYWARPRGTIDVDITVYLDPSKPEQCVALLHDIGCAVPPSALESLREHGFCRVSYQEMPVDVFLPIVPFYDKAKKRRRRVRLGDSEVWIWDAETLAVFKMMFFRRKDAADAEEILRGAGGEFDAQWVRANLVEMYGPRDPRVSQWDQLVAE